MSANTRTMTTPMITRRPASTSGSWLALHVSHQSRTGRLGRGDGEGRGGGTYLVYIGGDGGIVGSDGSDGSDRMDTTGLGRSSSSCSSGIRGSYAVARVVGPLVHRTGVR